MRKFLAGMACVLAWTSAVSASRTMDLAGRWGFALDPADKGSTERWFARTLDGAIQLPGSLQGQGFGDEVRVDTAWTGDIIDRSFFESPRYAPYREPGHIKLPFWLQPDRHYVGAAWYQRIVAIPADWAGKQLELFLERPHWQTRVWVDDVLVGTDDSLGTPHTFDVSKACHAGRTHRLTIRIDNRLVVNVGPNAHSVSDHTQSNWNGVVGELRLITRDAVAIQDLQVYPQVASRTARLRMHVFNSGGAGRATLTVNAQSNGQPSHHVEPRSQTFDVAAGDNLLEMDYPLGNAAQPWDEFSPVLYQLTARLECADPPASDEKTVTFGLREIGTRGTQFTINGKPIFLRGTLECCIFPLTGYPPTDVPAWKRVIGTCKAHGLNHMRFHSWTPPEAAFIAADELGFYFYVECSSWANMGSSVGGGGPLDEWLYREGERVIAAYGNHPSFIMLSYGNEPSGKNHAEYLARWVEHFRELDSRRKYTSAAAWPLLRESEFHVTPAPRIQGWGQGKGSRINALPPETLTDYRDYVSQFDVPVVSHEIGEWCVYPDFAEIDKYTGPLKPRNFEVFRDFLKANHMGEQARDFLMASGKLQVLCYKEEVESALRTPGMGGFELLDLHDFPGQGTALVGVLDPFWNSKPYITPSEYRRFAGEVVPLARWSKRVFTSSQPAFAPVDVANFGPRDLEKTPAIWKMTDAAGESIAEKALDRSNMPAGALTRVGQIEASLSAVKVPARLKVEVRLEGTPCANDWSIWVYPDQLPKTPGVDDVLVAHALDDAAVSRLKAGGKVLLLIPPAQVRTNAVIGFSTVFWNTAWTRGQPPHTMGILCDPAHPALAAFPTEAHSDWQWWDPISRSAAMVLDGMPPELRPLVQVIDTWFEARRLALVFEARVGSGRLIVSSIDLETDLASRPVSRQLRYSLVSYMAGERFSPRCAVTAEQVRRLSKESAQ